MIANRTPHASFDGGQMDIAVLDGFYAFGNTFTNDYEAAHLLDSSPAQFVAKGSFSSTKTNVANLVYTLDPQVYPILNPVLDNGSNPNIQGELSDYITAASLTKEDLAMPLVEGTNRFTLIAGSAGEFFDQAMVGLFVMGNNPTPPFIPGQKPTVAAADDNSDIIDAIGFSYCGYVSGDATYFQAATNYYDNDTLLATVNGYDVRITYFNMAGINDSQINAMGMSGNGAVGWVSQFAVKDQWGVVPQSDQAVSYLEVYVEEVPEPGMLTLILCAAMAGVGMKRRKG